MFNLNNEDDDEDLVDDSDDEGEERNSVWLWFWEFLVIICSY